MIGFRHRAMAAAGVAALVGGLTLTGALVPTQAMEPTGNRAGSCFDPQAAGASAKGGRQGADHRDLSAHERAAIEKRTRAILARKAEQSAAAGTTAVVSGASVPVFVHVMADAKGRGNVTNTQISQQIAVLNKTFGGLESTAASDTGFTFTLAGIDRYFNTTWHQDKSSTTYRSQTRRGGANALNIWLVDFAPILGIATFPWDYAKHPRIDGIRVQYTTLPGGSETHFNLGETATHEAGHWFGLYHTFQGGCTSTNDEVRDTPAQSSPTSGCPQGRDSCALPGLDPIHNYMDYSFDSCYNQYTSGQTSRMHTMFSAYRA
jgi:hypothetical protein